jgi:RNA-directed DNA polymerase
MEVEQRDARIQTVTFSNWKQEDCMELSKPFCIEKKKIWDAYKLVKANKGSAGIDEVDFNKYEENLGNNLYRLWNRMSSGSYMPKAVKVVEIPKKSGGIRRLGVPTIDDHIAQMVAKNEIEPELDNIFVENSYGYSNNKHPLFHANSTEFFSSLL